MTLSKSTNTNMITVADNYPHWKASPKAIFYNLYSSKNRPFWQDWLFYLVVMKKIPRVLVFIWYQNDADAHAVTTCCS